MISNLEEHRHRFFTPKHLPHSLRVTKFENTSEHILVSVPGSKSFSNRAVVLAGMSPQTVTLKGFLFAEDTYWGLSALQSLGFAVQISKDGTVDLVPPTAGTFLSNYQIQPNSVFLGKAGTLARFFPAVVLNFQKTFSACGPLALQFVGSEQLSARPLSALVKALAALGAKIEGESLPLRVCSSDLKGETEISGSTSGQFLSGLLLAAGGARSKICVRRIDSLVQPDYVRMTVSALRDFGVNVTHDDDLTEFVVDGSKGFETSEFHIEADASTAACFLAFGTVVKKNVTVTNLSNTSLQPDLNFVRFLARLGHKSELNGQGVTVFPGDALHGGFSFDFNSMSDQCLNAAVLALSADAPIEIRGIGHVRHHESNRIACLVRNINAVGGKAEELGDGFRIHPVSRELAGVWETFDDHRFAMAGLLLSLRFANIAISSPSCVEKTCPEFFDLFARLGVVYGT